MLYSSWSNEEQHVFIRIYTSFYSFERSWSFCGLWDRRTYGGKTDCHIDALLLLLTTARYVIFKTHIALLLLLGQGCSTGGLVWATGPNGRPLSDCKLAFTLAFTTSNSFNRSLAHWRLQPSAGRSHWLQPGSDSDLHCPQLPRASVYIIS